MVFSILPANTESAAYEIDNSLRFNDGDSPKLTKTFGSAGSSVRTFTISFWVKKCLNGKINDICGVTNGLQFVFRSGDDLRINFFTPGSDYSDFITNQLFRDPSAWYHIVLAVDTTQGTEANRKKLYVNGSQVTSFATQNFPTQNRDLSWNSTAEHQVGYSAQSNNYSDIYLSDFNSVDGSALDPTYFGETNDNGVWIPKKYTGSYGTNGFFLEFQQTGTGTASASTIGADTSGNTNHFTSTNLAATDITTDTPTNNFATLNIVNKYASPVVAEGALEYDSNSSSGSSLVSTIAPSNGKWYVEVKALTSTMHIGVSEVGLEAFNVKGQGATRPNINYQYGGGVEIDGSIIDNEATFTSNDILGFALNLDDGELIIYKNGTALNSGTAYNLHTNTTHGNTGFSVQTATGSGNTKASFNFGNPAFSISSGNADANGYGNFEYAPPSGYYALCTKNLAEFG
jgi:hypothetical protein